VSTLLEVETGQGSAVFVEVEDKAPEGPAFRGGRSADSVVKAGESLQQVLAGLGPTIRDIAAELRGAIDGPDEVEVEFAARLSADANLIIARTGAETNFRVALKWSKASS
jgi:hypothetical protein